MTTDRPVHNPIGPESDSSKKVWSWKPVVDVTGVIVGIAAIIAAMHFPEWPPPIRRAFEIFGYISLAFVLGSIGISKILAARARRRDRFTQEVLNALEFTVMLQKPQRNVLDLVTLVFTTAALQETGWKFDSQASAKEDNLLVFVCAKECCSSSLKVRLRNEMELEDEYRYSLRPCDRGAGESLKAANNLIGLSAFNKEYMSQQLAHTVAAIGHAESAYTVSMGVIYAWNQVVHISPYATQDDFEYEIGTQCVERNHEQRPRILRIPPANSGQVKAIIRKLDPILYSSAREQRHVMLIHDLSNAQYSQSLKSAMISEYGLAGSQVDCEITREYYRDSEIDLCTLGITMDAFKNDAWWSNVTVDVKRSKVLVVAGMYEFVTRVLGQTRSFLAAVRAQNPSDKVGPEVILVTDGVVNGDHCLFEDDLYRSSGWTDTHVEHIYVAFPQTGPKIGKRPWIFSDQLACWGPVSQALETVGQATKYYKGAPPELLRQMLSDPNYGYYVWLGAWHIGSKWHEMNRFLRQHNRSLSASDARGFLHDCTRNGDRVEINASKEETPFGTEPLRFESWNSISKTCRFCLLEIVADANGRSAWAIIP